MFLSEEGHASYQIKGKIVYSIVLVKCLTLCTPLTFLVGQAGQTLNCTDKYILIDLNDLIGLG